MKPIKLIISLLLLSVLFPSSLRAQEEKKSGLVGGITTAFNYIFNSGDTAYVEPNHYNLGCMLEHSTWYEQYRLGNNSENPSQRLTFSPDAGTKLGIYFGWRWIFFGYTFYADKLFGNKDNIEKKETSLSLYTSRVAFDITYRETGDDFKLRSYSGFDTNTPSLKGSDFDGLQSRIFGLSGYWFFNAKHYSHRAAYAHSTNQRRNGGSVIAGLTYTNNRITFDAEKLPATLYSQLAPGLKFDEVEYKNYSLSLGYGYNWVFAKNWVANLTLLPTLAYKDSHVERSGIQDKGWSKDLYFDFVTRAAVAYNNTKYFAGASFALNTYDYRQPDLSITNSFGILRFYAGFNFWPRKKK